MVYRKPSRRRQEARELPYLFPCFLWLHCGCGLSNQRTERTDDHNDIQLHPGDYSLLSDLLLWSRSLLLILFGWEETWLQSSFFPATGRFWTAGEKQHMLLCGDCGPHKIRKTKYSLVDNGTKFTYPLLDGKKELEGFDFDLWLLPPVHTSMPIPAQFVEMDGVPPLAAGWGWSTVVYFCLFVSLGALLALFLCFLLQQSQHYRNRKWRCTLTYTCFLKTDSLYVGVLGYLWLCV